MWQGFLVSMGSLRSLLASCLVIDVLVSTSLGVPVVSSATPRRDWGRPRPSRCPNVVINVIKPTILQSRLFGRKCPQGLSWELLWPPWGGQKAPLGSPGEHSTGSPGGGFGPPNGPPKPPPHHLLAPNETQGPLRAALGVSKGPFGDPFAPKNVLGTHFRPKNDIQRVLCPSDDPF